LVTTKTGKISMSILKKYAHLLVHYCLELQEGDNLFIKSTALAEPLIREVFRESVKNGVHVEVEMEFREKSRILINEGKENVLLQPSFLYKHAVENFDAYLVIRAPYNLTETQNLNSHNRDIRRDAHKDIQQTYFRRTADRSMKRTLCQFPTQASAQFARMSLEEYEDFVHNACHLHAENPAEDWKKIGREQQRIVDLLNQKDKIQYKSAKTDISFSVKDRIWINSDGKNNMPSGEVYSGPIENTVNGVVHFDYPSIYMGHEVEGITLWVEEGQVVKWDANKGKNLLDKIFEIPGSRYFGEVAIGTNYNIQKPTGNILFDEKIGGTIHMAIGQSYAQTGGTNKSSIHWDMICDMSQDAYILADGEKIYEDGAFIF